MAESCFSTGKIRDAIRSSVRIFPGINELKPEQILVVENIVRGKDVFAALPTGYGKSITFQILPSVKKYLDRSLVSPLVIVVCPLKSIIKDQVNYLRSLGLKAAFVGESAENDKKIIEGTAEIDLLYGSPESFVGDDKFRGMFSNDFFRRNTVAVVYDEVHTVVHWGERDRGKKNPFRKWCGAVGEIRALLPQGLPMLALTATASAGTRKKIIEMLSLHKSVQIVVSPNRDNIKLYLQKVTNEISDNFMWLVHELEQKQMECPKVLIYVRDYQRCSEVYHLFMQSLGTKAYYPPSATKASENRMVAMYHSGTSPSVQEVVLASLNDPNGKVRIIIATTALGMGVDIKGLHRVINYGPPSDIESYIQELGRAGRDGKQSEALVMFHGRQLHHCTPEMLEYLKSSSCRRSKLLELFDKGTVSSHNFPREKHLCCDICELACTCETIDCPDILDSMNSLKTRSNGNTTSQKLRPVSIDQKQRLKGLLREHQKMMREMLLESNPNLFYTNVDNVTCFTNQLIEDAVYKCDSLFSVEDILEKLSVWKVDHAHKIYSCLCKVFPDLAKP